MYNVETCCGATEMRHMQISAIEMVYIDNKGHVNVVIIIIGDLFIGFMFKTHNS